jgi:hypothetical protein
MNMETSTHLAKATHPQSSPLGSGVADMSKKAPTPPKAAPKVDVKAKTKTKSMC